MNSTMQLLVYGSKSFAKTVADLARHCGRQVAGFVDDFDHSPDILGTFDDVSVTHPPDQFAYAIGVGYSNLAGRWASWRRIAAAGYQAPALVHPRSYVADSARLGAGCLVMAGSVIDTCAELGEAAVGWPQADIKHDTGIIANTSSWLGTLVYRSVRMGVRRFIGAVAAFANRREALKSLLPRRCRGTRHTVGWRPEQTSVEPSQCT